MKKFDAPVVEQVVFAVEDVITTSTSDPTTAAPVPTNCPPEI